MNTVAHLILILALTGCATSPMPAPGGVRVWGTLREALRDGQAEARVDVAAIASPILIAVGAVAGLDGEITIVDGACHVSRVRNDTVRTVRSSQVVATLLAGAEVPRWQTIAVERDVEPSRLDAFIGQSARDAGLDPRAPFPFVVEGELLALDVHVLAGECPIRARMLGVAMTSPPFERRFERVPGQLVGIHALDSGGVITHHGATTHVHAILAGDEGFTGHCESVGIAAGAVLRLPVGWSAGPEGRRRLF